MTKTTMLIARKISGQDGDLVTIVSVSTGFKERGSQIWKPLETELLHYLWVRVLPIDELF